MVTNIKLLPSKSWRRISLRRPALSSNYKWVQKDEVKMGWKGENVVDNWNSATCAEARSGRRQRQRHMFEGLGSQIMMIMMIMMITMIMIVMMIIRRQRQRHMFEGSGSHGIHGSDWLQRRAQRQSPRSRGLGGEDKMWQGASSRRENLKCFAHHE